MEETMTTQQVLNKLNSRAVLILRGLPGAGKTTFIDQLEKHLNTADPNALQVVSADHFFVNDNGDYDFNQHLLGQAHFACKDNFKYFAEMRGDRRALYLVVDNTNLTNKEVKYYVDEAHKNQWDVIFITFNVDEETSNARNIHKVPPKAITSMAKKMSNFKLPNNCLHYIVNQ